MNIEERVSRLQSLINEGRIIRARWSALDEAAWRRVEVVARRASVVEAMRHTTDERVLDACRGVLVWLDDDMPESSRTAVMAAADRITDSVLTALEKECGLNQKEEA
jgi:hypothetical protein